MRPSRFRPMLALLVLLAAGAAGAAVPRLLDYQGQLADPSGGPVADAPYNVVFRLYAAETGGEPLWTENQSVPTRNGLFSTVLGSSTPLTLPFDAPYFLGLEINSGGELAPRVRLTSAPYSLRSADAEQLDGLDSADFLRADGGTLSGDLTIGGALVLSADPSAALGAATKQYVDAGDAARLPLAGGTLGGALVLSADPSVALGAATKQYVDAGDAARLPLAGGTLGGTLTLAPASGHALVTTAGNTGLGTAEPQRRLHVVTSATGGDDRNLAVFENTGNPDSSGTTASIRVVGGGVTTNLTSLGQAYTGVSGVAGYSSLTGDLSGVQLVASDAAGTVRFLAGGSSSAFERMRVAASGNVGIGTSTPAAKLEVNGQLSAGPAKVGTPSAGRIEVSGSAGEFSLQDRDSGSSWSGTDRWLIYHKADVLRFWRGNDRLSIVPDADDSSALLSFTSNAGNFLSAAGWHTMRFYSKDGETIFARNYNPETDLGDAVGWASAISLVSASTYGYVRLSARGADPNAPLTHQMYVTPSGVGVGTAAPVERLEVKDGNIRVTNGSFIDDGTALEVPDYVFEPGYELMPLEQLREHLRRERHLPNVPSAEQIGRSGVDLGAFQMRLLEKIEELTLYTLEQQDQLEAQRDQLEAQRDQLEAQRRQLERLERELDALRSRPGGERP